MDRVDCKFVMEDHWPLGFMDEIEELKRSEWYLTCSSLKY